MKRIKNKYGLAMLLQVNWILYASNKEMRSISMQYYAQTITGIFQHSTVNLNENQNLSSYQKLWLNVNAGQP